MASELITYGNFRRPKVPGVLGLSAGVSAALAVAAMLLITFAATGQLRVALLWGGTVTFLVAPLFMPSRDGLTVYDRLNRRVSYQIAKQKGYTVLRQGPGGKVPGGKARLPGLGAALELFECVDPYGGTFGLVVAPNQHLYTVVIECNPWGTAAVDQETVEVQVAQWGAWLGSLGRDGGIAGASVTVETIPDSGYRLASAAAAGRRADAPAFALQVLDEAVAEYPEGSAQIVTRLTVTWSGVVAGGKPRTRADMMAEVSSRLPQLVGGLRGTGAGMAVRACTAPEIIDHTRAAYDPSAAADIEEARAEGGTGLHWDEAGPSALDVGYDMLRHDGAYSMSWQMAAPPRGVVYSVSMAELLLPHRQIDRKRVTLLYRPENPVNSAQAVEQDINLALWSASNQRRPSARVQADIAAARKTAQEEALGAALVRFGMIVTATVSDPAGLPLARQTVESLSATARLHLRPAYGNQDVAFLAGLPLGVILPKMTILPSELRDML